MPSFKYPYIMGWRNSLAMLRITVMFFQRTKVWVLTPVSDSSESPETATPRDPITSLGLYGHYNIHENTHKLFFFLIYKTIQSDLEGMEQLILLLLILSQTPLSNHQSLQILKGLALSPLESHLICILLNLCRQSYHLCIINLHM